MNQIYQIKEYGSFITGREVPGYVHLPESTFTQLENFILSNKSKDTDALEIMGLSAKKGVGKVITAKNYVGILSMKDGTTIEILPKIDSPTSPEQPCDDVMTKRILIEMLKTLRNAPYKSLQTSNMSLEKMNIFEVFIRMFVNEIFFIVKRGLKCSYELLEENQTFLKGKIKFAQQIKYNHSHMERNYVEYDEFNCNRPENKLIKSTLLYLYGQTTSMKNKNDIRLLLNSFGEIHTSTDYNGDFAKYIPDRNVKDYSTALLWCRVFLMGKTFTSFSGSDVALALLFPMETLFESYIAAQLRKRLSPAEYSISIQDKSCHLFDLPGKKFLLKPDIVVTRKADHAVFVLDTKWKVLSDCKSNYGISQADMYQMYAYQKKYGAKNITLIYPASNQISLNHVIEFISGDGVHVQVKFVDFFDIQHSINAISDFSVLVGK